MENEMKKKKKKKKKHARLYYLPADVYCGYCFHRAAIFPDDVGKLTPGPHASGSACCWNRHCPNYNIKYLVRATELKRA
jgi:hypothetical protein